MATAVRWAGMPAVAPMLATLGALPADDVDEAFGYEIKWDGVRAVGYVGEGFHLVSRNGSDMTATYPELAPPQQLVGRGGLIVDGEIVAFDAEGKPSFAALQPRMHQHGPRRIDRLREQSPVVYIVFDVLCHTDRSVTRLVYCERRALLDALGLDPADARQAPSYQCGDGARLCAATREAGLEGVIAKRLDAPVPTRPPGLTHCQRGEGRLGA